MFLSHLYPLIQDINTVTLDMVIYKYNMKTAEHLTVVVQWAAQSLAGAMQLQCNYCAEVLPLVLLLGRVAGPPQRDSLCLLSCREKDTSPGMCSQCS